ncbi:MAG: hypothetical protein JWN68_706 [Nocardioides sp.]|nr:hypothetical protein [Nocardioides sp.]
MRPVTPHPPGPRQESAWDYPRPPRVEPSDETIEVRLGGVVVASTQASVRVLETSHPPSYYLPLDAFEPGVLRAVGGTSFCEWKGVATYYDLVTLRATASRAGWTYAEPTRGFEAIRDHVSIMPPASWRRA